MFREDPTEWDSLCSHNPLSEGVGVLLPAADLESIAVERREKALEHGKQYSKKLQANPISESELAIIETIRKKHLTHVQISL